MAWKEAVLEIVQTIREALETDIPDYPQAMAHNAPSVFVYATEGITQGIPMGAATLLDTVTVAVFEPYVDLESQVERMLPYREDIPLALMRKRIAFEWQYVNTFGDSIEHTFGQFDWGGQPMIGYLFSLREVKVQVIL